MGVEDLVYQRHHVLGNRFVKLLALRGSVIEPTHLHEFVVAVVFKTCIDSNLVSFPHEISKQIIQTILIQKSSVVDLPIYLLPFCTVWIFQIFSGLLQGELFSIDLNHHLACDLSVLLLKYIDLCLNGDISFTEQFDVLLYISQIREIGILIKRRDKRRVYQFLIEDITLRLNLGLDLQVEEIEGFFQLLIGGITGHTDLTPAGIFTDNGFQLVNVLQPFL